VLIAAGHEVTGLARSDTAAAVSALGAKVRRGDLGDLEGLMEAAADSDGVIHVAHRQDLLPFGGMDAVSAAELPVMLAYGEALAGTGKPLVAAGSIGSSGKLGRPATEEDPALPVGDEHKGTLRVRNVVETAVIGLAERGVRSSVVRIANIAHSTTDVGFLPMLIALAKEKGFAGYPGDGANLWNAVHARDVASLFRLALEKGPVGRYWHAVGDEGIPVREIAGAIGSRLGLPRRSTRYGLHVDGQPHPKLSCLQARATGRQDVFPGDKIRQSAGAAGPRPPAPAKRSLPPGALGARLTARRSGAHCPGREEGLRTESTRRTRVAIPGRVGSQRTRILATIRICGRWREEDPWPSQSVTGFASRRAVTLPRT
jgi:nucleoside-diphosphate-sugar epimerase